MSLERMSLVAQYKNNTQKFKIKQNILVSVWQKTPDVTFLFCFSYFFEFCCRSFRGSFCFLFGNKEIEIFINLIFCKPIQKLSVFIFGQDQLVGRLIVFRVCHRPSLPPHIDIKTIGEKLTKYNSI